MDELQQKDLEKMVTELIDKINKIKNNVERSVAILVALQGLVDNVKLPNSLKNLIAMAMFASEMSNIQNNLKMAKVANIIEGSLSDLEMKDE